MWWSTYVVVDTCGSPCHSDFTLSAGSLLTWHTNPAVGSGYPAVYDRYYTHLVYSALLRSSPSVAFTMSSSRPALAASHAVRTMSNTSTSVREESNGVAGTIQSRLLESAKRLCGGMFRERGWSETRGCSS